MKKFVSIALLAVMLTLTVTAVHSPGNTVTVWKNPDLVGCFDTIVFCMPDGNETMMDRYGVRDGHAVEAINANPITLQNEVSIICRGWAGIVGNAEIAKYGYRINDGAPVFSDSFLYGAEQAVYDNGGNSRYVVEIPVAGIKEPTLLTVTSLGTDGLIYDILEFSVNGAYMPEGEKPDSPFERRYGALESGTLNVVIDGGLEPYKIRAGKTATVNVKLLYNTSIKNANLTLSYDPDLQLKNTTFPIKSGSDTAKATVDAKTHTVTLTWSSQTAVKGDVTFATLTFETASDVFEGDFLHVTAESFSGASSYNLISGGVEIESDAVGDVNGDDNVNNKDVVALFRLCSGYKLKRIPSNNVSDVNRDKKVNNKDVALLFRAASGSEKIDESGYTPTVYGEKTGIVTNVRSFTFNDGFAGNVIGVYCETEPDCEVVVCDKDGNVLLRENTINRYFYGRFILPSGVDYENVYIYAKAADKDWSSASGPHTLAYSSNVGANAMIAHDSHVFYNQYVNHYNGNAAYQGDREKFFGQIKNYLYNQLDQIRDKTKKNTKIIIAVCTNPATVYHEVQYTEEEGGWGDKYTPTSYSLFAEYMKGDENIYVIDLRDLFEQNKDDRLLFMQADSHWTSVAGYYAYYRTAQMVKQDFPKTNVYDLDADFNVSVGPGGGDLLNFMGASGVRAANTAVSWKSESMRAASNAPTAYVMGDSYYWSISGYLELIFGKVYLNEPASNPPLYDYTLSDLQTKKPDYLMYIWTERNIDTNLNMIVGNVSASKMR